MALKNKYLKVYVITLLFLLTSLTSCKEDFHIVQITIINDSNNYAAIYCKNIINDAEVSKLEDLFLASNSRGVFNCPINNHFYEKDQGVEVEILEMPLSNNGLFSEVNVTVKYYSIEELQSMGWTVIYKGYHK